MRPRVTIAVIVVAAIGLSACAPGDIAGVIDELPSGDLTQSSDPAVRAAGQTPIEILAVREAEDNLERGVAERDITAVQQAARLRPEDPKYPLHEAALLEGDPANKSEGRTVLVTAIGLVADQNPDADVKEMIRITQEMYLDALLDVIKSAPEFEGRDAKVAIYCTGINSSYPDRNTDTFPQEVALYLAISADFSVCN